MRTKLLFFGTCQAESLCNIYNSFLREDNGPPAHYLSSNRPLTSEHTTLLADADLIINQVFSFEQMSVLPRDGLRARIIDFPHMAGIYLWPYATEEHINRRYFPTAKSHPYDAEIGDAFLNRVIQEGLAPSEAAERYLSLDILKVARIPRRTEMIADQQRAREAATEVRVADFIEQNRHKPDLFLTRGHPNLELLLHTADQVFEIAGVPRSLIESLKFTMIRVPDHSAQAPIHPRIAEYFGLSFVGRDPRYEQFHGHYTFTEYCQRYVQYEWNQGLVEGIYLAERRQDDLALGYLTDGLRQEPTSAQAHNALGRVLGRLGHTNQALVSFKAACDLDPNNPNFAIDYSNRLSQGNQLNEALAELQRVSVLYPSWPRLNLELSHLLSKMDRVGPAAEAAELAIRFSSKRGALLPHLGRLLVRQRDFVRAFEAYEEAIKINPNDAASYHGFAQALLQAGKIGDALVRSREAARLAPSEISYLYLHADLLNRLDRPEEAISVYELVLDINPDERQAHVALAHIQARQDRLNEAIGHGVRATDIDRNDRHLLVHLSNLFVRTGDLEQAVRCCIDAIAIDPRVADTHHSLSRIMVLQNKPGEAIYAALMAVAMDPERPEFRQNLESLQAADKRRFDWAATPPTVPEKAVVSLIERSAV
jgi:tetratricopeptide (TPR) repeat protein